MMLQILEKYFLEHGQLVIPGIGELSLHQTDATQINGQFKPPVHKIIFNANVAPSTQPSKLFYIFLSDYSDCTTEQAMIDYAAFFTNQLAASNRIDLGNLGQLNLLNDTYFFDCNYNSMHYFQSIDVENEEKAEEQFEDTPIHNSTKQWWILPLLIAAIAIAAILLK